MKLRWKEKSSPKGDVTPLGTRPAHPWWEARGSKNIYFITQHQREDRVRYRLHVGLMLDGVDERVWTRYGGNDPLHSEEDSETVGARIGR